MRAALESKALIEAPTWDFVNREFGNWCKIDSSSYYAYTNMEKDCPYDDPLFEEQLDDFKKYR
jgi:hypothetical protein